MRLAAAIWKRANLTALAGVALAFAPMQSSAQITSEAYLCRNPNVSMFYVVNLNGDNFGMEFYHAATGRSFVENSGGKYYIRFGTSQTPVDPIPRNQQDLVSGRRGPGYVGVDWDYRHRIVFWIDFKGTPKNLSDDYRVDAYLMTQSGVALSGVIWMPILQSGSTVWRPYPFAAELDNVTRPECWDAP